MAVAANGVMKCLVSQTTVDEFTLTIEDGSICVLLGEGHLGQSASGLRLLGGSFTQSNTTATVEPRCLSILDFDKFFHIKLTGYENLRHCLTLFGQNTVTKRYALKAMDKVGLNAVTNNMVGTYSKAEKIRLAMALIVLGDWKTVLLDEPTHGLDKEGVELMYKILCKLKTRSTAILLSTHDKAFMRRVADTVVLFKPNHMPVTTTPDQVDFGDEYLVHNIDNDQHDMTLDSTMMLEEVEQEDLTQLLSAEEMDGVHAIEQTPEPMVAAR